ncbi:MAG: carbohydrate ABC transporter permease [Clostridia bacterium]|nr:carbohydrate ABC transporter permease [Clostridia bacterium]
MKNIKEIFKRNPNKIKESKLDTALVIINIVLLVLFMIVIALPLLNFFSLAFNNYNFNKNVIIFPKKISWYAFSVIFKGSEMGYFWTAFGNSVLLTLTVTIGSNLVEAMAAYPLSKRDCPIRGGIMMYFIITMLFSAGTAPIYMLMLQLNLTDNIWSCVLISISNVGNLLYFKVFFEGLPKDIEDSARLDGATEIQMFFRIVIPMSLPVIGSCCFFSMVGAWNGYGSALLFISPKATNAFPLAYYLYLLNERLSTTKSDDAILMGRMNIQAAAMLVSIIPIICCYPYVIRYIKGGLMIGSVKE